MSNMEARNQPSSAVTKIAPSWLAAESKGDKSIDMLREQYVLPRVKVLQGLSKADLVERFGTGSAVLQPGDVKLCGPGESFLFVPLLAFSEFIAWNDRKDTTTTAIQARSFSPTHEIARFAKDPALREQAYGPVDPKTGAPQFKRRFTQHLNFAGVIYNADNELKGVEVTLSFVRGEFKTGQAWMSAIMLRRVEGTTAPLWSQVWKLTCGKHSNQQGWWYAFDITPPESPWIEEALAPLFKASHEKLRAAFEQNRLVVDREDEEDVSDASPGETNRAPF